MHSSLPPTHTDVVCIKKRPSSRLSQNPLLLLPACSQVAGGRGEELGCQRSADRNVRFLSFRPITPSPPFVLCTFAQLSGRTCTSALFFCSPGSPTSILRPERFHTLPLKVFHLLTNRGARRGFPPPTVFE